MFTGIEVPFVFAFLYPGLNHYWWYPKLKPDVEKEIEKEDQEMDGVEMFDYHNESVPPVYVNLNNIILPVGGGMNRVTKVLLTKHISKDKEKEYGNKWQFYAEKGYWVGGLYNETQKTQEVLATLNNNFEIEGRYSKKGFPIKK